MQQEMLIYDGDNLQDEIISLPVRQSTVVCQDEAVVEDDMRVMEVTGDTPVPADDFAPLKPPPAMFQPIQYPPLHIFVCSAHLL